VLGLVCGAVALLAGPAYRAGIVALGTGLQLVRWAATLAAAGAAVAFVAGALHRTSPAPRAWKAAVLALALNVAVAGPPLWLYLRVQQLPRIHDITTDTEHPPVFVAVLPLRADARNPVDYPRATAEAQKKGYPDVAPLTLGEPPPQALARAERAARAMGWQIVALAPQDLRLEATDTSALFGFKDDIVVRITPAGGGSIVDVRSLSRVGGSDFGVNARRVRAFLRKLASAA
jgi:uncharacterized protein (DUF1499 family)